MKRFKQILKRMLRVQCVILLLFNALSLAAFAGGESTTVEIPITLENSTFEKGSTTGWRCGYTAISDPLTFVVESAFEGRTNVGKISGFQLNRTWEVYNTGSETGTTPVSVEVEKGDKYIIKAWMYGLDVSGNKSGSVSFCLQFMDNNGSVVNVNHKNEVKSEIKQTIGFKGSAGENGVYYCEVSLEDNKIVFKRNFGATPREEYAECDNVGNISKMLVKFSGSNTTGSPLNEFYIDDFSITRITAATEEFFVNVTSDGVNSGDENKVVVLADAGKYLKGGKATIKATVKEDANYVFDRWEDSNTGETISLDPIYTFEVNENVSYIAKFKKLPTEYKVEISTCGSGTVNKATGFYTKGSIVTLSAAPTDSNYKFVCWEVNGKKVTSAGAIYNLTVDGNYKVKAYFTEAGANRYTVTFKDTGGRILKIQSVENSKPATAPAVILKPGYEFVGWDKDFSNITGDTEVNAIYKPKSANVYTVSISNGTITNGSAPSIFDELVEVIPNGTGKFSYWKYNGEIISYNSNFSFYVSGNVVLTAVFGEDVQAKPAAVINSVIQDSGMVSFIAQCTVPHGFAIVEYGVLMSSTINNPDLGTSDVIKGKAGSMTDTGQFMVTKEGASGQWYGRAYIICRDGSGNLVTIYSNVQSGTAQ